MEQILKWDPEIIYLSNFDTFTPEDLYNNKIAGQDWRGVSAVKNKKVYKTPLGIYRWDAPNAETPLFLKWIGQKQQPGVFSDYNLENDLKKFYKDFFKYDLTEADMNQILQKGK
jgi:iron complex transport system substrate-binding protein